MVVVDVPPKVAERLNTASANRRWFPFDDDVIDWSVPLSGEWSYMPAGRSCLSTSGVLDTMEPDDRSFVERWEMTQIMRNTAHGEHLLNQGILAMLWHIDPMDPSYRYLLHEVAEECQHMAMFNQWVRINDDIKAYGIGEELWGKMVADFTQDIAERLPEAFWVNVLLFEFVGDEFNQQMRADERDAQGDDGRALHPILVQIGQAHTAEEARHIAYARRWLHEGMPKLSDEEIEEVRNITQLGAEALVQRRSFLPVQWSRQLEPYISRDDFNAAQAASPASEAMLGQLKKLLDEFEELGAVRPESMREWEDAGAFD